MSAVSFRDVTFSYQSGIALFTGLQLDLGPGWTGVVGANGSGKSTLLRLACGLLSPTSGSLSHPKPVTYCPQGTDEPPADLASFLQSLDADACRLRGVLEAGDDWRDRWLTLSPGEQKRAQIGVALWQDPALLAVDEPTNHLDAATRDMLAAALTGYDGVGLLVSHDRELLDTLCVRCLFVEGGEALLRSGAYSAAVDEREREKTHARERYEQARSEAVRLQREAGRRRAKASGADARRSKRKLARRDSDGRAKIDAARVTGKDGKAGRLSRQLQGRLDRSLADARDLYAPAAGRLVFWMPGSRSRRDSLLSLPAGSLSLGPARTLVYPDLRVSPSDRVAIIGRNGAGKSTLVRHIIESHGLSAERVLFLPQELGPRQASDLVGHVRRLGRSELGHLMTVVSGLGSDPERLLATEVPSPGEARKLLLALGVTRQPWLLVLDEPTNHLDLPSIELLERALCDCPAALILVSHDRRFLDAVAEETWRIEPQRDDLYRLLPGQAGLPA